MLEDLFSDIVTHLFVIKCLLNSTFVFNHQKQKVTLSHECIPLSLHYVHTAKTQMIRSSPRISSAQYQFLSAEVDTAVLTSVLRY